MKKRLFLQYFKIIFPTGIALILAVSASIQKSLLMGALSIGVMGLLLAIAKIRPKFFESPTQ